MGMLCPAQVGFEHDMVGCAPKMRDGHKFMLVDFRGSVARTEALNAVLCNLVTSNSCTIWHLFRLPKLHYIHLTKQVYDLDLKTLNQT